MIRILILKDPEFTQVVLLTYRSFTSSHQMLDMLRERYLMARYVHANNCALCGEEVTQIQLNRK